jgi:SHS2 domain-containing protein
MEKAFIHYILKAEAIGEFFNPEKHPSKVGIKAVTYHQMEIIQKKGDSIVKFIIDV